MIAVRMRSQVAHGCAALLITDPLCAAAADILVLIYRADPYLSQYQMLAPAALICAHNTCTLNSTAYARYGCTVQRNTHPHLADTACRETNEPLTDVEFLGQAWSVCFVGYDKMVGALCGMTSLVATHAHVQERLLQEIDGNEAEELPTVDTMHLWPYAQVRASVTDGVTAVQTRLSQM